MNYNFGPKDAMQEIQILRNLHNNPEGVRRMASMLSRSYPDVDVDSIYHLLLFMRDAFNDPELEICIWDNPMVLQAQRGADVFTGKTIRPHWIPTRNQWWTMATDGHLLEENRIELRLPEHYHLMGILIMTRMQKGGVYLPYLSNKDQPVMGAVYFYQLAEDKILEWVEKDIRLGKDDLTFHLRPLHDMAVGEPVHGSQSVLVAKRMFMMSKVVEMKTETLPRGDRRRLQKKDEHIPEIRTVTLRKKEERENENPSVHPVDWSCRWTVQPHWRKNWHDPEGDPVYVPFHLKGPADKPLKENRPVVYKVSR